MWFLLMMGCRRPGDSVNWVEEVSTTTKLTHQGVILSETELAQHCRQESGDLDEYIVVQHNLNNKIYCLKADEIQERPLLWE